MIKSWLEFKNIFSEYKVEYNGRLLLIDDFLYRVYQYSLSIDSFKIKKIDAINNLIYLI